MSLINGDKGRDHRQRKARVKMRAKIRALRASLEQQKKKPPAKPA